MTGCSAEYNLEIGDDFSEEISVVSAESSEISDMHNYDYPMFVYYSEALECDGDAEVIGKDTSFSYYDVSKNSSGIDLSHVYDLVNYHDSYLINYCYGNLSAFRDDEGMVSLITGSRFNCMDYYSELDEVTVKVKVNYDVVDSNADMVNGNTYSWVVDRSNYRNKNIYLVYDSGKEKFSLWKFLNDNIYYVGLVTILVIIGIVYLILKKNSDAKNVI